MPTSKNNHVMIRNINPNDTDDVILLTQFLAKVKNSFPGSSMSFSTVKLLGCSCGKRYGICAVEKDKHKTVYFYFANNPCTNFIMNYKDEIRKEIPGIEASVYITLD